MKVRISKSLFAYRVESTNLHLDIHHNQLNIWGLRTGLGICLHLAKISLEKCPYQIIGTFEYLDSLNCNPMVGYNLNSMTVVM